MEQALCLSLRPLLPHLGRWEDSFKVGNIKAAAGTRLPASPTLRVLTATLLALAFPANTGLRLMALPILPVTTSQAATGGFYGALQRGQTNIGRYAIHVRSPLAKMVASALLKQSITEFGPGGQPVVTGRTNPQIRPEDHDLNAPIFRSVEQKAIAMAHAFRQTVGRYPQVSGEPLSADDVEYLRAVEALLDGAYGPDTIPGTWVQ